MKRRCQGSNSAGARSARAGRFSGLAGLSLALVLLIRGSVAGDSPESSALWGRNGEHWKQGGRLPDFSYAGYHRGEKPLPDRPVQLDVTQFGATGDGTTDDTAAFKKAIAAAKGKVLFVPAGRYRITDILDIRDRGTVVRGAGQGQSVLFCPKPLNDIKPNWGATTSGKRTSNYSWSGGIVRVTGSLSHEVLTEVTAAARRGERTLAVARCEDLRPADEIRLVLRDTPRNTLAGHLYAGDPGPMENLKGRSRESFSCRITRVDASRKRIELDRSLRTDIRMEWQPRLYRDTSSVEEVGIENLVFEFPTTPYGGHFTEVGYNALALSGVRNCWVRGLRIQNADSGIFLGGVNITLQDVVLESERRRERQRQATGHHGVTLGGQDNLLLEFEFRTRFMHGITVTRGSAGNVASSGRGVDLAFDHHRYGPHANLFTDIDLGEGSRMFQSGGGAKLGRHSAAYETFWCIRARRPLSWPDGWGPDLMNIVGVRSEESSILKPDGRWFEVIAPEKLRPRDLYRAQLAQRLAEEASSRKARQ